MIEADCCGGGGGCWPVSEEDPTSPAAANTSGGTSPTAWVSAWRLRSQFRRNTLPHALHSYGLWSVCVSKWVFKLERWLKLRAQTGHLCGDSSMWRILWTANVRDWQKPLPHSPHLNGFSFEWIYLEMKKKYKNYSNIQICNLVGA